MLKKLQSLHRLLKDTPLLINQNKKIPYEGSVLPEIVNLQNDTEILLENFLQPLKIVLMGEVKAGKSTLLNAFAGSPISPTNVTETTASIIEIKHSMERKGIIHLQDGNIIEGTTDYIFEILKKQEGNQDFFKNVLVVRLSYPLVNLQKLHLVDTPGLATITEENEQRTFDYIQNSDVIIWVFNAHHIGQHDVEDELEKVKFYGKPIIGVVNRIDEIDGSPDRVKTYMETRMGFFLDEVFPISAYQAYNAMQHNDEELLEDSGFAELMEYLNSKIENNHEKVQEESIINSAKAIIEKSNIQHQLVINSFEFSLSSMKQRKEELKFHNESIKRKINNELEEWIVVNFLKKEKDELLKLVEQLGMFSGKAQQEAIRSRMEEILSKESIEMILKDEYANLDQMFREEWHRAIEQIGEKMAVEMESFEEKQQSILAKAELPALLTVPHGENALADGAMKGAAIGGAYGVAASAYAAVLGPYAATVTIGTALGALLPPVLIIGAATGAVAKLVFHKKKKNEFNIEIDRSITELKNIIKSTFAKKLLAQIEIDSNQTANQLYEMYSEQISGGWNETQITAIQQQIRNYQSQLIVFEKQM